MSQLMRRVQFCKQVGITLVTLSEQVDEGGIASRKD